MHGKGRDHVAEDILLETLLKKKMREHKDLFALHLLTVAFSLTVNKTYEVVCISCTASVDKWLAAFCIRVVKVPPKSSSAWTNHSWEETLVGT